MSSFSCSCRKPGSCAPSWMLWLSAGPRSFRSGSLPAMMAALRLVTSAKSTSNHLTPLGPGACTERHVSAPTMKNAQACLASGTNQRLVPTTSRRRLHVICFSAPDPVLCRLLRCAGMPMGAPVHAHGKLCGPQPGLSTASTMHRQGGQEIAGLPGG